MFGHLGKTSSNFNRQTNVVFLLATFNLNHEQQQNNARKVLNEEAKFSKKDGHLKNRKLANDSADRRRNTKICFKKN